MKINIFFNYQRRGFHQPPMQPFTIKSINQKIKKIRGEPRILSVIYKSNIFDFQILKIKVFFPPGRYICAQNLCTCRCSRQKPDPRLLCTRSKGST